MSELYVLVSVYGWRVLVRWHVWFACGIQVVCECGCQHLHRHVQLGVLSQHATILFHTQQQQQHQQQRVRRGIQLSRVDCLSGWE